MTEIQYSGLSIQQIGLRAPDTSGPLGSLEPSRFLPGQSVETFLALQATTVAVGRRGYINRALLHDSGVQQTIYQASKKIADYTHEQAIADVIYLDRSARPIRVGVREYEKLAYPAQPSTDTHFLSPALLRAPSGFDKSQRSHRLAQTMVVRTLGEQLAASHSSLLAKKQRPILLVDCCLHTGETLFYSREALRRNGFQEIHSLVVADDHDTTALVSSDVCLVDQPDDTMCRLFGMDFMLEHQPDSMYTKVVEDPASRAISQRLRAEIRQIVQTGYANKDQSQG